MQTDLLALAARVEGATEPTLEMFRDSFTFIIGEPSVTPAWDDFVMKIASDAWLDAAMMLVPEGAHWMVDNFDGLHDRRCSATVFHPPQSRAEYEAFAATASLALTAAAIRAFAAE